MIFSRTPKPPFHLSKFYSCIRTQQAFQAALAVKNPLAVWETWVQSLGWKDPLEKEKATHSSILAWRIPWSCKKLDTTE